MCDAKLMKTGVNTGTLSLISLYKRACSSNMDPFEVLSCTC